MEIVIDANVLKGYYDALFTESHLNPTLIFERLGQDIVYLDEGGQIKQEWRNVVEPEWFDGWYAQQLSTGHLQLIPAETHPKLLKKLVTEFGFPRSRDQWYIRVAKTVFDYFEECTLITEDGDFYDPKQKASSKCEKNAPVAKFLRKKEGIIVQCVVDYLEQFDEEDEGDG